MSKFKKGETSKPVIDKKIEISSSIKRKTELINKIECFEDIPSSLEMKKTPSHKLQFISGMIVILILYLILTIQLMLSIT